MSSKPIKFFYARVNATNTIAFPVDRIRSFSLIDQTSLKINIEPALGDSTLAYVDLTITEGTANDVMRAIVEAGRSSRSLFITLGDEDTKEYVHSGITAVASLVEGES